MHLDQHSTDLIHSLCPFCRLIASIFPGQRTDLLKKGLYLYSICQPYERFYTWDTDRTVLAVLPPTNDLRHNWQHKPYGPCIVLLNQPDPSRSQSLRPYIINSGQVPYDRLKSWIRQCKVEHFHACEFEKLPMMSSFKLIDCTPRSVIEAPSPSSYVALSYVWGSATTTDINVCSDRQLPSAIPRTIEDAMTVTKQLGYRFLWIDRYCIDQQKNVEKHQQIRQMGSIYHNADVTIIAAAGPDPSYGLPGVEATPRRSQMREDIGGQTLIAFPDVPQDLIQKSAWMSRA